MDIIQLSLIVVAGLVSIPVVISDLRGRQDVSLDEIDQL